ncbi:MAG TPA: hypothetical protein VFT42_07575 [Solirubrobacteraceae bacterium]|nr:hypothetical protein [Solirubrobacteraceae bacterium]
MLDRELRELLLTLCTAAGAVLALPWAITASGALTIVARLAIGGAAGLALALLAMHFRSPHD